jgi:hypothetical protein
VTHAVTDAVVVTAHREDPITDRTRAVARSTGSRPADWGRAVALALDHLAAQVAFRDDVPEPHVLEGRGVLLHALPGEHGVEIVVELAADRTAHVDVVGRDDRAAEADRRLRDSVGYAPGTAPRSGGDVP